MRSNGPTLSRPRKPPWKMLRPGDVLAVHPPREVHQQLLEHALEERHVAHAAVALGLDAVQPQRRPRVHGRVHVVERPLVRGKLAARVHVPLARELHELVLREIRIDQPQRDHVEREVPRREPRVLPRVGHREDVVVVDVLPRGVAAVLALRRRRGRGGIAVEPVAHHVVVELLRPDHARERAALDRRGFFVHRAARERRVELVRFRDAQVEQRVERTIDPAGVRAVGDAQPHRARRAGLDQPAVVQRRLRARAPGVDPVAVFAAHGAVDPALDVRRRRRHAERALEIRFVLREEVLRRAAVGEDPALAERRVLRDERVARRIGFAQRRLRRARAPRPLVAKPQLRQQMQRRALAPAVGGGDAHEHVVDVALRVLHHDVEVRVVREDAGVDELVLAPAAPARVVLVAQLPVRKRALRIAVQRFEVRLRRNGVEVPPVLLDVLAVIALRSAQAVEALFDDLVVLVPERGREAQPLVVVADAEDAVLAPAVRAQPRHLERKVVPRAAVGAVVLANGAPLAVAEIRPPAPPMLRARRGSLDPRALGIAVHGSSVAARVQGFLFARVAKGARARVFARSGGGLELRHHPGMHRAQR